MVAPAASRVATDADPSMATMAPAASAMPTEVMEGPAATADPTVEDLAPALEAPKAAMTTMAAATDVEEPNTTFRPFVHERNINLT